MKCIRSHFTMLEMVVVLVIAGIVTGIAVGMFHASSGKIALEEHREALTELLIAGRRAACKDGIPQKIIWEESRRQWHWSPRGETLEMPGSIAILPEKDPETGDPVAVIPEVIFYGNGTAKKNMFCIYSDHMIVQFRISAATGGITSALQNTDVPEESSAVKPLWEDPKP